MGRKQLAMYLPAMGGGGAELVFALLSHVMVERGYQVTLILNQAQGPTLEHLHKSVEVVDLKATRSLYAIQGLVRILRSQKPLALLSGLDVNNVIAISARSIARVPTRVVVSVHNMLSVQIRNAANWQHRALQFVVPATYPYADGVVAVTDVVADDLAKVAHMPRSRITRIYNPIRPDIQTRASAAISEDWYGPGMPPTVLAAGRLVAQKDFVTLLRAFALVRRSRNAQLIILGEGQERARLEALVASLGLGEHVRLPGHVANPYPHMRRAALFTLSSAWEGFGLVLVEALACGTPVVSTDCKAGPAEILKNGEYGRLVPVGDHEALAKAIVEALDSPPSPQRLRDRANDFDLTITGDQYLSVLTGSPH